MSFVRVDPQDYTLPSGLLSDGTLDSQNSGYNTASVNNINNHYTQYNQHHGKRRLRKPVYKVAVAPQPHTPLLQSSSSAGDDRKGVIKPSEMMYVAVNYGGLPGYAYVSSLLEYSNQIVDDRVEEVVARRCDLLTDRAHTIGTLFLKAAQGVGSVDESVLEECMSDKQDIDSMIQNNDLIIKVLRSYKLTPEQRDSLLRKLERQLTALTAV